MKTPFRMNSHDCRRAFRRMWSSSTSARTGTYALCNVTFPYVLRIANDGLHEACRKDPGLAAAVNLLNGQITNHAVAETFGLPFVPYSGQLIA